MIDLSGAPTLQDVAGALPAFWELSAAKIRMLEQRADMAGACPVTTVDGRYTGRNWTDWTEGFRYGSALIQYEATGDETFLDLGRQSIHQHMFKHVTHFGVHDHGFNIVSTYGHLRRLRRKQDQDHPDVALCEQALSCSAAVQGMRWFTLSPTSGYIYSFNGPQSLFVDTMRSLRSLVIGHSLTGAFKSEGDISIRFLDRAIQHINASDRYLMYYGEGRDQYDEYGRVAHEAIFNVSSAAFRCPSTQQGYSPFSTWTRGQAWMICGAAELIQAITGIDDSEFPHYCSKRSVMDTLVRCARASADHFIRSTPRDGIAYWDTGAPGLQRIPDHAETDADPYNDHEPVDSSASAIAAQGLLRLAACAGHISEADRARYRSAALRISGTLFSARYLAQEPGHQGLLLHTIYHRPNGWDHIPAGAKSPRGESCMWGDYHLRELALMLDHESQGRAPTHFFD